MPITFFSHRLFAAAVFLGSGRWFAFISSRFPLCWFCVRRRATITTAAISSTVVASCRLWAKIWRYNLLFVNVGSRFREAHAASSIGTFPFSLVQYTARWVTKWERWGHEGVGTRKSRKSRPTCMYVGSLRDVMYSLTTKRSDGSDTSLTDGSHNRLPRALGSPCKP